ncbi:MAG: spore germination protein, partial [Dehalobacterium sp.]
MLSKLFRKFHFWLNLKKSYSSNAGEKQTRKISGNLDIDLAILKNILGESNDISYRLFHIGLGKEIKAALVFVDGLVDKEMINDHILRPLMAECSLSISNRKQELLDKSLVSQIELKIISLGETRQLKNIDDLVDGILSGNTLLLVDKSKQAILLDTRGWQGRSIDEPETEVVVRGPREGFTETLRTNTSMLRRKIKDPHLTFDTMRLGTRSKTDVSIAYIKGVVKDELIDEIKRRLKKINTDAILDSGYIEQFIEDNPLALFATIGNSEKPDVVAAKILEGRAAIFVDGTPIVLTIPLLFVESFQSAEDYYNRP